VFLMENGLPDNEVAAGISATCAAIETHASNQTEASLCREST